MNRRARVRRTSTPRRDAVSMRLVRMSREQRLHALSQTATDSDWARNGSWPNEYHSAGPPPPPLELTPAVACDPAMPLDVLEYIARTAPELRQWLVANPRADAELLEYVSQAGGPGVREALTVLLASLEEAEQEAR